MRGMAMPSPMGHKFSEVPRAEIPRSVFDRSSAYKTTLDTDYLVPFFVDEVLPGDTFAIKTHGYVRALSPLKVPIMDNVHIDTFYFFVPNRLVWDNFVKFQGEQRNPGDSVSFTVPTVGTSEGPHTLSDYFGIPDVAPGLTCNALHFRAYNLIWAEWFRDQNLSNSPVLNVDDGPDDISEYPLRKRAKRHDYFTSCLPWPQKGTAVSFPLAGLARVQQPGAAGGLTSVWAPATVNYQRLDSDGANVDLSATAGTAGARLEADLATATNSTINELRQAFQVQKMYERDARGGTRYTEAIKARFGVTSDDARLQRPEYLGGGTTPLFVSPVAQTTGSPAVPTQLDAAGRLSGSGTGTFVPARNGFTKSFTEHGVLIGLINIRADLTYQQGLHRMWQRQTRVDFYEPVFSHIGEQSVLSREIWCDGTGNDATVFGYQERHAEYRYKPSLVTGLFRSDVAGTLDLWHLSQDFATRPTLNETFILEAVPMDRVIAVPAEPQFVLDAWIEARCARPMPVFGVPGLIDHF